MTIGAAVTERLALAVFPEPPSVEDTGPAVLVNVPAEVAVTPAMSVQLPPGGMEPPVSEMLEPAATAAAVPPQVEVSPFGVEMTRPAGKLSVNVTSDSATVSAAGLVMVKVSVVPVFTAMLPAAKASAITGGATTAIVAEELPPEPPSAELTAPVILIGSPAAVPVTFTENVQEVFGARVAPLSAMRLVP